MRKTKRNDAFGHAILSEILHNVFVNKLEIRFDRVDDTMLGIVVSDYRNTPSRSFRTCANVTLGAEGIMHEVQYAFDRLRRDE